jgi:hypothetical protein
MRTLDGVSYEIKNVYEDNRWTLKSYENMKKRTSEDLLMLRARSK